MDIAYLLWLQDFRTAIGDALTPLMEEVSFFAISYLLLIPVFIYWCLDKKKGLYVLFAAALSVGLNAFVKLNACVYRPWIRDPRVVPAGDSIKTATGYSFPSGHTTTATPIYGGIAIVAWQKYRWLSLLCIAMVLLTGFSRNYLGVHTPQDVLVGMTLSVCVLWAVARLMTYFDAHPEKVDVFLLYGIVISVLMLVYITFKSYPMTYKDGRLLVDPKKMMSDGYGDIGKMLGFFVGLYVERHWVRFRAPGATAKGVFVCLLGIATLSLVVAFVKPWMYTMLPRHWGKLGYNLVYHMYIVCGFPFVLRQFFGRE